MKQIGNRLNGAWSVAMAAGSFLFAAIYFVLSGMTEHLKSIGLANRFNFISFANKYAPISKHPEAFTVALGAALLASMVLGTVIGCQLQMNREGIRRFTERSPRYLKLLAWVCLPGLLVLPFIPLAPYDGRLPHDRWTASILSSDLGTALFIGVMHSGYLVFYMVCVLVVRYFFARS